MLPIWNTNTYNGVTNARQESIFGALAMPVPPYFHTFFDDFDTYTAGDWTVTETDAAATQALTAGDGGLLLITNTADDDDLVSLQKVAPSFTFVAGKRVFFEARFLVSDATQTDFMVGLQATNATPFTVVDGVVFVSADGAATLNFQSTNTSVSTTATAITTVAAATMITLSFYYDGISTLAYAVNGTVTGTIATTTLPAVALTPTISMMAGEAGAETMTLDYIFVAKERQSWPMQ